MPKIQYESKKFRTDALALIRKCNEIIADYTRQGYTLTLRQLYYQLVARDVVPNTMKSYKRVGSVVNDGRLAGLIDWDAIEDRTRNLHELPSWHSPESIVDACAKQFRIDKWQDQDNHVEVWIEKEALSGVFERVCDELQIPFFACRGYTSQSEAWSAGRRLMRLRDSGKVVHVLHFGDHDPSGIDMSRDVKLRLRQFSEADVSVRRLALNMDQVEEFGPPPNPAKATDSRFADYQSRYGDESWELDALDPATLAGLVRDAVLELRDGEKWQAKVEEEREHRRLLQAVSDDWARVTAGL